jgi:septal ring factor EnvC (AmiA/AmiB activator)
MGVNPCYLAIVLALATPAIAQPAAQADDADCKAEKAEIERDMELARSKGQMLHRRQLAETLAVVQARCENLSPAQRRAANIEKLEREIRELRKDLDHAEEELRKLRSKAL